MALKDWKREKKDWWLKDNKSIMIIEVMSPNKKEIWWGIRFSTGGFHNIPQTSLVKKYTFTTKAQALKYAKAYMKKH